MALLPKFQPNTNKHPRARKSTRAAQDGKIRKGKKRHAVKEFRKSTLPNARWAHGKKWRTNSTSPHQEMFFIDILQNECVKRHKITCGEKMAKKSPRTRSQYTKTRKNEKTVKKRSDETHDIFVPPKQVPIRPHRKWLFLPFLGTPFVIPSPPLPHPRTRHHHHPRGFPVEVT